MVAEQASTAEVLKRFAPMIYGPTVLFSLGEGAVVPIIPVIATSLGADIATASLIGAALVLGQLCGNLPAGWAVMRFGERITMVAAGVIALAGVGLLAIAATIATLMVAVFLIGCCAAAFGLARHAFMTTRVSLRFRARALSLLGGSFRLGMFVGPFISAALLWAFGDEHASVWFLAVCLVAVIVLVFFGPDPEVEAAQLDEAQPAPSTAAVAADTGEPITGGIAVQHQGSGVFATMWRHRSVLARLGGAAAALSAVRASRQVLLPLWGVSIGMDAQTLALVIGISGAVDFALFYASGQVMDRFGRLWAAVPALLLMGAGFAALSVTHDLSSASMWFATFAMLIGVGNGLSSGILLTLGADVAPAEDPAAFLGSWRTLTDAGGAAAPLAISAVTAGLSIAWASGLVGVIALLGVIGFLRWVPRYVPRAGL